MMHPFTDRPEVTEALAVTVSDELASLGSLEVWSTGSSQIPDGSDRFANRSGVLILALCTDNHPRALANSRESGLSTI